MAVNDSCDRPLIVETYDFVVVVIVTSYKHNNKLKLKYYDIRFIFLNLEKNIPITLNFFS